MNSSAKALMLFALIIGAGGTQTVEAADAPGLKSSPVHRVGHTGVRHHGHHRHRWVGSSYWGPSWGPGWYGPWAWGGPSVSIGYWGRRGSISVPIVPVADVRWWGDRENWEDLRDEEFARVESRREGPTPTYVKTEKSPSDELAITAQRGQTLTQQSFDRIDCERAAIRNTGYEPAAGGGAVKKAEWVKDVASCMSGKGYAVK
ncbi:MAG: hypothetical protein JNJ55_11270 [Betaproteobacteria bacterium]|nr:hypothetical protein [Betaproteobacteria bacterium]